MAFILLLLIRVSSLSYTTQLQHFIIIGYYLYLHYWLIHYTMITTPPELKSIGSLSNHDGNGNGNGNKNVTWRGNSRFQISALLLYFIQFFKCRIFLESIPKDCI